MRSASGPPPIQVDHGEHLTSGLWRRAEDNRTAVRVYRDEGWVGVGWRELCERVRAVAGGLIASGIQPGDRVAIMSSTRLEWTVADLAILSAGGVTVPLYETDAPAQCSWVCSNAQARLALAETQEHAQRIEEGRGEAPDLEGVLVLDDGALDELAGRADEDSLGAVHERLDAVDGDTLASIVYTSGTTGRPKGCALTHRNLVWTTRQATQALERIFADEESSTLLFLPLARIFTRVVQYGCLQHGVGLGYARSIEDLAEDVATFRPTFLLGVPRVFEKIHDNARRQASGSLQKRIFDFADRTADEVADDDPGAVARVKAKAADTLVYDRVRATLGGRLHTIVSGGAPLSRHLANFFEAAGITILQGYGLTHETLGAIIIRDQLGHLLRGVRRNPNSQLQTDEQLDPGHVAWLIQRPHGPGGDDPQRPKWLRFLRSLLSGIYTIDNLDFVLRDAYMSGYSQRAYDLDRLLHYSFFSTEGLTIHDRGMDALLRFMGARAELFRSVYFHRTVRAIDLTLADLFADSKSLLFPGNPQEHLPQYQKFTEASLLVDVGRWEDDADDRKRRLGQSWQQLLRRELPWTMICQRSLVFAEDASEAGSIFADAELVERRIRRQMSERADLPFRVDVARAIFRPHTRGPALGQNFLFDPARGRVRPLTAHQLFQRLPVSQRICRIYARSQQNAGELTAALDNLLGGAGEDDLTNL